MAGHMIKHIIFIVMTTILVGCLLILLGMYRYNDYRQYHEVIANEAVNSLANAITTFISERQRLVRLFGENNLVLLQQLARDPDNIKLEEQLRAEASRFFPSHFSLTITDEQGELYLEDYDGLMGELCFNDIREFAVNKKNEPRVHPHIEAYHFDIMSILETNDNKIILFISFRADILANAVLSTELPGHQLMLTYPTGSGLIEVSSEGARNVLARDNYLLTAEEGARLLASKEVLGTSWFAEDFHHPDLFIKQRNEIISQFIFIYIAFLAACLIMLMYLRKEEKRRKLAESHKDDFLSLVSHELRTPLTAINGSIGLVVNGVTGDISTKAHDMLAMAQQNCIRLVHLVNDLLDMQKIEAGKMTYNKNEVLVSEVLERSVEGCQSYAEQHQITYELILPPKQATSKIFVNIDENRIIQVLLNLLSNAAKYGAKRDIVEVKLQKVEAMVTISVTDHGSGIPADLKNSLFDQFTRAKEHVGSNIKGTGLGLNISKRIMDEHDGNIGYTTTASSTCFYITLPISRVEST